MCVSNQSCVLIVRTAVTSAKTTDVSQELSNTFHVPLSLHPSLFNFRRACCLAFSPFKCCLSSLFLCKAFYAETLARTRAHTHTHLQKLSPPLRLPQYQAYHPYFILLKQIQCKAQTCGFHDSKGRRCLKQKKMTFIFAVCVCVCVCVCEWMWLCFCMVACFF